VTSMNRVRLGIVVTHPIQYQVPMYRHLALRSRIDPLVFFLSDHGLSESFDPAFGRTLKFDVPLLGGYEHQMVPNRSPKPSVGTVLGVFNPSLPMTIRRSHVDALLVHGYSQVSHWLAYLTAFASGIPYLLRGDSGCDPKHSRGAKNAAKQMLIRPLVRNADACLAIGKNNGEFYRSYGAQPDRIFFAPYSVDSEYFSKFGAAGRSHRGMMLKDLGLDPSALLILYAGKLYYKKSPIDLVMAMDQLHYPKGLIVIGDGPLRPEMEQLALTRPWMRMLGFVNQSKIAAWYGAADLYVLPSSSEKWGLAVNEAMAAGAVPIVSDAVGCAPDLVTPDVGWVYPAGDTDALASVITAGRDRSALADRRLAAQRRSAEYGIAATVRGIEEALEAVLAL
jgi:glycosyltransferase involved in cell wall biosynthesis